MLVLALFNEEHSLEMLSNNTQCLTLRFILTSLPVHFNKFKSQKFHSMTCYINQFYTQPVYQTVLVILDELGKPLTKRVKW